MALAVAHCDVLSMRVYTVRRPVDASLLSNIGAVIVDKNTIDRPRSCACALRRQEAQQCRVNQGRIINASQTHEPIHFAAAAAAAAG